MDREQEKAWLRRLRATLDRMDGDVWTFEADGDGTQVMSLRSTGDGGVLCRVSGEALSDEYGLIVDALTHARMFLGLIDRCAATLRDATAKIAEMEAAAARRNLAAQAAMLCDERSFQRFLEGQGAGGPVRDKGSADTRLKSLLAIASKTELNTDMAAAARFRALRRDYDRMMRGAR